MATQKDDGSINVRVSWDFEPDTSRNSDERRLDALEFIAEAVGELVQEVKAARAARK